MNDRQKRIREDALKSASKGETYKEAGVVEKRDNLIVPENAAGEDEVERIDWRSIPKIEECFPLALMSHISKLDSILQADLDTIALSHLPVLCTLAGGASVYDKRDSAEGTPLIIYIGVFFKSGGGKTSTIKASEKYWLRWLSDEYQALQDKGEELRAELEAKLKSLGKSKEEQAMTIDIGNQLREIKDQPDVTLDGATAEGLTEACLAGSILLLTQDNFGKILRLAEKNDHYSGLLKMLDDIFDSASFTTKRTKSGGRAKSLTVRGLGGYFASTIGNSNLKPKDIRDNIENGFFNKMLITMQDKIEKPLPLDTALSLLEANRIKEYAIKFREFGSSRDFVLSHGAYELYKEFHREIGKEYQNRYNNDEDLAGMVIRQLKISKRIACLFEISNKCETMETVTHISSDAEKELISVESMRMAINLLQYLRAVHIPKIMQYANSKDGKLSATNKVHNAIRRLNHKGIPADIRMITQYSRITQENGLLVCINDLIKTKIILHDEKRDVYISNT